MIGPADAHARTPNTINGIKGKAASGIQRIAHVVAKKLAIITEFEA